MYIDRKNGQLIARQIHGSIDKQKDRYIDKQIIRQIYYGQIDTQSDRQVNIQITRQIEGDFPRGKKLESRWFPAVCAPLQTCEQFNLTRIQI